MEFAQLILAIAITVAMLWIILTAPLKCIVWIVMTPWRMRRERQQREELQKFLELAKARERVDVIFRYMLPYITDRDLLLRESHRYHILYQQYLLAAMDEFELDPSPINKKLLESAFSRNPSIN